MRTTGWITCVSVVTLSLTALNLETIPAIAENARSIAATVQQRADTTVRNAGAAVYPGIATLREEISIGREGGPEEYLIVEVQDLALGADGSIFIADRGTSSSGALGPLASIRQYDSTGKFVRRFGRGGQGPGEYAAFNGMRVGPNGTLYVHDNRSRRVTVFSRTGEVVASWPTAGQGVGNTFIVNPSNGMSYHQVTLSVDAATGTRRSAYVRYGSNGTPVDTLHEPPRPEMPDTRMSASAGRGTQMFSVPFAPTFRVAFNPLGYFMTARSDRYAIDLNIPGGNGFSVTSIRRDVAPLPVTAEERTAFRADLETRARRVQPNWTWSGPDIPRNKPHFLMLSPDMDGRIWVRVIDPSEKLTPAMDLDDDSENFWDVFEPSGRYLGKVKTGIGVLPGFAKGFLLPTLVRDSSGVQRVTRSRISWGAPR